MVGKKESEVDVLTVMAGAVTGADPEFQQLLKEMLRDRLKTREEEKKRDERKHLNAIQQAQEQIEAEAARRGTCSHLKQDGRSTRLVGQWVTGTPKDPGSHQIVLVCQFCGKTFHHPARKDQTPVPPHLFPSGDEIGGE